MYQQTLFLISIVLFITPQQLHHKIIILLGKKKKTISETKNK